MPLDKWYLELFGIQRFVVSHTTEYLISSKHFLWTTWIHNKSTIELAIHVMYTVRCKFVILTELTALETNKYKIEV